MTVNSWSIVQYRTPLDRPDRSLAGVRAGTLLDGTVRALPEGWPETTLDLLDHWDDWAERLRDLDVSALPEVDGAKLTAPLTYPRKLLCAGANYYEHAAEMGTARPDPAAPPFFFLKPPTTTVIGPYDDISVPELATAGLDWEVELAVVVGRRSKGLTPTEAVEVVAGYTVANDISARSRFPRPHAVQAPFAWDWLAHKALDDSCPLGPGIVPTWLVQDPQSLGIRLQVSGTTKQDSSTSDMVVGVAQLVSAASRWVTLEPGDVILSGTPAGVGMPRQDFLRDGDVVTAEIDGIGRLENTIVSAA